MKITITAFMALAMTVQLLAQCRLVRTENADSSEMSYFFYDKQGRLSAEQMITIMNGKRSKSEAQYAYNAQNQLVTIHAYTDDTLIRLRNLIYVNNVPTQMISTYPVDTSMGLGTFFYNEKGQVVRYFEKSSKGNDSRSISYEYAPEGWLKRGIINANGGLYTSWMIEHIWDSEQKIIDEPSRIFFAGYPLIPSSWIFPIEPLSVKGNAKGYIQYNMDKEGKFVKTSEGEVFDIKANAEGLWIENKYRVKGDPTVYTYRAFYEGCKN
jgi:YD repeat-containing protein